MANDQQTQNQATAAQDAAPDREAAQQNETDGLSGKKPEDLTPEELRLMADTMPGEGPGD